MDSIDSTRANRSFSAKKYPLNSASSLASSPSIIKRTIDVDSVNNLYNLQVPSTEKGTFQLLPDRYPTIPIVANPDV
ncbi:hypothetical protein TWF718_010327 [Orbilia javanica]|uniref:Uncharacterized protein n=1 Tax=Orbilia javanica TaxID=47235 RepID=A0AAN8MLS8_9PEZI